MKHTPAPWGAIIDPPLKSDMPRACLVATGKGICIDATNSGETFRESAANARLIAMAPTMYGFCKAFMSALTFNGEKRDHALEAIELEARAIIREIEAD